ncbi:MAG: hypothetical protein OXE53_14110 [Deltaproteobacteria bacterium]|nr:hypothetical protein [Deltaproteobacteria bacterium]
MSRRKKLILTQTPFSHLGLLFALIFALTLPGCGGSGGRPAVTPPQVEPIELKDYVKWTSPCHDDPHAACTLPSIPPLNFGASRRGGEISAWVASDEAVSTAPLSATPWYTNTICPNGESSCVYGPWLERLNELQEILDQFPDGDLTLEAQQARQAVEGELDQIEYAAQGRLHLYTLNPVWLGRIVGLTPAGESVSGSAHLRMDIETLEGDLTFSSMRLGEAQVRPWGDGDLAYDILVSGNGFVATGGDEGGVNGQFYGAQHQLMGGILERTDLTAAFGGTR